MYVIYSFVVRLKNEQQTNNKHITIVYIGYYMLRKDSMGHFFVKISIFNFHFSIYSYLCIFKLC